MKNLEWYKPTNDSLVHGMPALKHKITKELCTFGKKGQAWEYDNDTINVLVYTKYRKSLSILNSIALNSFNPLPKLGKGELILRISKDKNNEVKQLISVPNQLRRQIALATKFDQELHLK